MAGDFEVVVTASAEGYESATHVFDLTVEAAEEEEPDPAPGPDTDPEPEQPEEEGGCGSFIGGIAAFAAAVPVIAAVAYIRRKRS